MDIHSSIQKIVKTYKRYSSFLKFFHQNFTIMKSTITSVLLLAVFLFVGLNSYCQKRKYSFYEKPVEFDLLIATNELDRINPIVGLQIQAKEGFLSYFSLFGGAEFYAGTQLQADFKVQEKSWAFMGELRIFPFGPLQISNQKKMPWEKKRAKYGCYPGKFCGIRNFNIFQYLKGLYIAPGYRFEKTAFEYIPLPHLESPVASFPYRVTMQGPILRVGYQFRFSKLTAGINYGLALSQPQWKGSVDIFGDDLYTNTYPLKFRVENNLRFELGINF